MYWEKTAPLSTRAQLRNKTATKKPENAVHSPVNGINQFEVHLRTGVLFKKAQKYPHLLRDDFENSKIYTTRFTLKQSYIRWF